MSKFPPSGMSEQLPFWAILIIVLATVIGAFLIGFIAWKKKYIPIATKENIVPGTENTRIQKRTDENIELT